VRFFWLSTVKDLRRYRRDAAALALCFLLPLVITGMIGLVFGRGDGRAQGLLLIADEDDGLAGYRLFAWDRYRVGLAPDTAAFGALAGQPRKLQLHVEGAGEAKKLILGYQQSLPGFIVTFTLQVSLTAGCVLLIAEPRKGVLRRLAATPVSPASIVSGKLGYRVVMGLIQVGVAMLAGRWWFGMEWVGGISGRCCFCLPPTPPSARPWGWYFRASRAMRAGDWRRA
jgi:ABC-type Na+ efflux pump permease subunit